MLDQHLEQETIELSLGKRIRSRALNRVLRRQDEERSRQGIAEAVNGNRTLLHRLEHRRLRLGWCPVDFVREQDVGEDGAVLELEVARLRVVRRRSGDIGGHEIGRELDPAEVAAQYLP
jgi:hypothetical protein